MNKIPPNLNDDETARYVHGTPASDLRSVDDDVIRPLLRTISTLRADLARVTAERDAAVDGFQRVQQEYAVDMAAMSAERDRATAAAAALKEEFKMYLVDHEKWGNGLLQTMTASRARAERALSTDVGAAYAAEHEEMQALLGRVADAWRPEVGATSLFADIERVLKVKP
jgi:hypothetical protein